MKKISTLALAIVLLLQSNFAFAHESVVTIDYVGGIPATVDNIPIVVPYLPYTLDIEGTVSHDGSVHNLWFWATDNDEYIYEPNTLFKDLKGEKFTEYTIPWTITYPGVHIITIDATHKSPEGVGKSPCKAAPALANEYLNETGSERKAAGKSILSGVGKETGKKGELWAKEKCEEGYYERTISFVVELQK